MRKVIWCCTAAGLLAASSFLSLAYYACRCPDSMVGRSMQVIAEASLAMQPLNGLSTLARHASQTEANTPVAENAGSVEECIPEEPKPFAEEPKAEVVAQNPVSEPEAAPIVIGEEDPMPREQAAPIQPAATNRKDAPMQAVEVAGKGCPVRMPYCQDDEEDADKPASQSDKQNPEDSQENFKLWLKLMGGKKESKPPTAEELPAPTEEKEPQAEPKCEEDPHRNEQYPGCPRVTRPYTGKSYPARTSAPRSGKEEASEEPPQESNKPYPGKIGKGGSEQLPSPNVDTMEYRKSDAGLNEYGPGPVH